MEQYRELTVPERTLRVAIGYLGLQEFVGGRHNEIIVDMFKQIGHSWVKDDETAWCSCFVNFVALLLGLTRSGKLDARSWLNVGTEIEHPLHGDIVVVSRPGAAWMGHVGVFCGYSSNGNIMILGGNQANEVNITAYKKDRLLGFRRLSKIQ